MRLKKLISLALTLALTAALLVPLPAGAAKGSFDDITDEQTAVNADILRLMGVVGGTGGNSFAPHLNLTRAQFCKMAVEFLQRGDEVQRYATRTIFTDVSSTHWGRAYINLAASLRVGGEEGGPLFAGVGDGRFLPDNTISLAESVTVLLRALDYTGKEAGAVWPQGYMDLAASIGLTDGLPSDPAAAITRGQAAQLFVNALTCKTAAGKVYYEGLGSVQPDPVIILAVGVKTDDGSSDGGIRATSSKDGEAYLPARGTGDPYALQGKRGDLVLDDKGRIVTFVPDDSSAITITLSGKAQPSYVKGTDGRQYTMSASTMLYTADSASGKNWREGYSALQSGSQITMYSENGKIVAVYGGGAASGSGSDAVVVMGRPSVAMFHQLTGGADNYTILKNRQPITMSDIQEYDVVTYDSMNNTLIVSDLRLTCVYEDAEPNAKAPTTIKILGKDFEVLDSAWDTIDDFSLGKTVTLLLTADGRVAGMAQPGSKTRSTAIGQVTGDGATVFLPNGGTLELKGTLTGSGDLEDQLVTISSGSKGKISASRLTSRTAPGDFDLDGMKLGQYTVTAGVKVYEKVGAVVTELNLGDLDMESVAARDIDTYHLNTSDMVDYIVLKAITGDAYTYGKLIEGELPGGSGDMSYTNRTVKVENGTGGLEALVTGYSFRDGGFGGVVEGTPAKEFRKAASVIELTAVSGVSPSDFFVSQGVNYVNAGGKTYRVANDVEGYKAVTKAWFTEFKEMDCGARISAVSAFSDDLTVYIDPIGQKVRIIEAK